MTVGKCSACGRKILPDEPAFSGPRGGRHCAECNERYELSESPTAAEVERVEQMKRELRPYALEDPYYVYD